MAFSQERSRARCIDKEMQDSMEILDERCLQLVRSAWRDVLGIEENDESANFFLLGGDSMRGAILMALIAEATCMNFSLADLYEHPTIRKLSILVASRGSC